MRNKIEIGDALSSLHPGSQYAVLDNSTIEWLSEDIPQPTQAEIDTEVARLQAEYDNAQYARDRAAAYPSIEDQLDKIYHSGINAWKADIKAVKDTYPKG